MKDKYPNPSKPRGEKRTEERTLVNWKVKADSGRERRPKDKKNENKK